MSMAGDTRRRSDHPAHDYDGFWKEALDQFLPDFFKLVAPEIYDAINWTKPVKALDTELQAISPRGRKGKHFVDRLYEVTQKDGQVAQLLLHIEIQVGPDRKILRRVYSYRFRIGDKLKKPVFSMLVLADDNPKFRPSRYEERVLSLSLVFDLPVIKLLDFKDRARELESDDNPFALLLLAWFKTRQTKPGQERLGYKIGLVRLLREKGYSRDRIMKMFRLIDWLVQLPKHLQGDFVSEVRRLEGGQTMPFVTPTEELFMEKGMEKGIQKGRVDDISRILSARFGEPPSSLHARLLTFEDARLQHLVTLAATTTSLEDFLGTVGDSAPGSLSDHPSDR